MQMVVAEEAVKKGLDKTPEVGPDQRGKAVRAGQRLRQDFIKNNPVTDDTLKAEYERIKATVSGNEYKARHILVDKEAEAKDIIARLKKDPAASRSWRWRSRRTGLQGQGRRTGMVRPERHGARSSALR